MIEVKTIFSINRFLHFHIFTCKYFVINCITAEKFFLGSWIIMFDCNVLVTGASGLLGRQVRIIHWIWITFKVSQFLDEPCLGHLRVDLWQYPVSWPLLLPTFRRLDLPGPHWPLNHQTVSDGPKAKSCDTCSSSEVSRQSRGWFGGCQEAQHWLHQELGWGLQGDWGEDDLYLHWLRLWWKPSSILSR